MTAQKLARLERANYGMSVVSLRSDFAPPMPVLCCIPYTAILDRDLSRVDCNATRASSQNKDALQAWDFIIKIRRSWDRLIFIMEIPIVVRQHLHIETSTRSQSCWQLLTCQQKWLNCFSRHLHITRWVHMHWRAHHRNCHDEEAALS